MAVMHHSQDQLEALWRALASGAGDELLQRYTNPHMPGVLPSVVHDDPHAQVLVVPAAEALRKHVYARLPGGSWVELS